MTFDIGDKYGDSRDIEKIISNLEDEISDIESDITDLQDELDDLNDFNEDGDENEEAIQENAKEISTIESDIQSKENEKDELKEELDKWTDFRDEFKGYVDDWNHGVTLIHDDYFEDYIKNDLIPDVYGEVFDNLPTWLENNIDWKGVAEDFKVDYTSGTIDGVEYWAL